MDRLTHKTRSFSSLSDDSYFLTSLLARFLYLPASLSCPLSPAMSLMNCAALADTSLCRPIKGCEHARVSGRQCW